MYIGGAQSRVQSAAANWDAPTLETMFPKPGPQLQPTIVEEPRPQQDFVDQLWPVEVQRMQQYRLANQYNDLCKMLQHKMKIHDHESRSTQIRDRLRLKMLRKLQQSKKSTS